MPAPGATDLAAILAHLDVHRRPGVYRYVDLPVGAPPPPDAVAMIDEGDSRSYVVPASPDVAAGADEFLAAWLTITVATSLDAVGLTAVMAGALAAVDIPANVLAGARHDHLLVPAPRADDALRALRSLRAA